jgi:CubicO group peptidase (beta-lactamase class C family)
MRNFVRCATCALSLALCLWVSPALVSFAAGPTAKPEEVGLSQQRLQRIHELVQRHIDGGSFSGAVTLVARDGRLVRLEAQGLMDLEARKPMAKDGIFRIMSMTKPIVGAAILMLVEEGKVRLADPASKFIPEIKGLKVAVQQPNATPGNTVERTAAEPQFYVVPSERESRSAIF